MPLKLLGVGHYDNHSLLCYPRSLSHLAEEYLKSCISSLVMIIYQQQQMIQQQGEVF